MDNLTVFDAAGSDERIIHVRAVAVARGHAVLDLGEYGTVAREQVVAQVGVENTHTRVVVRFYVVYDSHIPVHMVAVYLQAVLFLLEYMLFKVGISPLVAVRYQVDKQVFTRKIYVQPYLRGVEEGVWVTRISVTLPAISSLTITLREVFGQAV